MIYTLIYRYYILGKETRSVGEIYKDLLQKIIN